MEGKKKERKKTSLALDCNLDATVQKQGSEWCGKNSPPHLLSLGEGKIRLATPLYEKGLRAFPLSELGYQQLLTLSGADPSFWKGVEWRASAVRPAIQFSLGQKRFFLSTV